MSGRVCGVSSERVQRSAGAGALLEEPDADVRHEVVDGVEGFSGGDGERLGRAHPHHERPGQARARGDGNRVNVGQRYVRLSQGFLEGGDEGVEVGPGGDLGNHAAEADVFLHGGGHGVRQKSGPPDDADAGFVAGGLDAEHERLGAVHGRPASFGWGLSGSRGSWSRMIRASTPSR